MSEIEDRADKLAEEVCEGCLEGGHEHIETWIDHAKVFAIIAAALRAERAAVWREAAEVCAERVAFREAQCQRVRVTGTNYPPAGTVGLLNGAMECMDALRDRAEALSQGEDDDVVSVPAAVLRDVLGHSSCYCPTCTDMVIEHWEPVVNPPPSEPGTKGSHDESGIHPPSHARRSATGDHCRARRSPSA